MARRERVLILGAAGRDFHNFNVVFRDDSDFDVRAFTAAQIPRIAGRRYPATLAGALYPEGIMIAEENDLGALCRQEGIDVVVFAYSDVNHEAVMHLAARAQASGADFLLLGPCRTMIDAGCPVIAVSAVRTGCGKSQVARWITSRIAQSRRRVVAIRHPMPYGDLATQAVQCFRSRADLTAARCTIEEREEYEPYVERGIPTFAGVDYRRIAEHARREADVILWDGGNNDFPFLRPDLHLALVDALRPGHETAYFPGETVVRSADAIIIAKSERTTHEDLTRFEATLAWWRQTPPEQSCSTHDPTPWARLSISTGSTPTLARCYRPWAIAKPRLPNFVRRSIGRTPSSWSPAPRSTSGGTFNRVCRSFVPATSTPTAVSRICGPSLGHSSTGCRDGRDDANSCRARWSRPAVESVDPNTWHQLLTPLVPIVREHKLILTHGNGPQVGLHADRAELALDDAIAASTGWIGYRIEASLRSLLPERSVATVISLTTVSNQRDSAKPIGRVYDRSAEANLRTRGWRTFEDRGGIRRLVASSEPEGICDTHLIDGLLRQGAIVIAGGGGGVPVRRAADETIRGEQGVVDKGFTASLIATAVGAERLLLLTDVQGVAESWPPQSNDTLFRDHLADGSGDPIVCRRFHGSESRGRVSLRRAGWPIRPYRTDRRAAGHDAGHQRDDHRPRSADHVLSPGCIRPPVTFRLEVEYGSAMMKTILSGVAGLALVGLGSPLARAVDLKNEDSVEYQVHIVRDGSSRTLVIRPRQTIRNICSACEISIEDIGVVQAEGDKVAIIRGSYLSVDED